MEKNYKGLGLKKINALLNLISHQPNIDKIYQYENKHEQAGIRNFTDPKSFLEYLSDMKNIYPSVKDCNLI